MRAFEYKRLPDHMLFGPDGIIERLGVEGWQLMHVTPPASGGTVSTMYLFMREATTRDEPRSLFEQVFGKGISW